MSCDIARTEEEGERMIPVRFRIRGAALALVGGALAVSGCGGSDGNGDHNGPVSPPAASTSAGSSSTTTAPPQTVEEPNTFTFNASPSASRIGGPSEIEGDSPPTIYAKAYAAAKAAGSVHIVAKGTADDGTTSSFDLTLIGSRARSELKTADATTEIVAWDGNLYARLNPAELRRRAGEGAAALIGDRYLKTSASDPRMQDLLPFVDVGEYVNASLPPITAKVTAAEGKDFDGVPTVCLKVEDQDGSGIIYISNSGAPFPVAVVPLPDTGSIRFTDWNGPLTVTRPSEDQVIDLPPPGTP